MPQIVDFNNNRIFNNSLPVNTGLELFAETNAFITSSDNLFIDRIIVTATGDGYTTEPSIILTMVTGSVIASASTFTTTENNKLSSVRLTYPGLFSLNSSISGSVSGSVGAGASVFVSTTRTKQINSFNTNSAVYDAFNAAKDKIRLVLYTKKGEVPRMPELGTRMYSKLLDFEQIHSLDDFVNQLKLLITEDINNQVPEVQVLEARVNESETDLDKNKIGISLVFRHILQQKTSTIDLSLNDSNLSALREHFTDENNDQRAIRYLG